jgi:hypothetical protein
LKFAAPTIVKSKLGSCWWLMGATDGAINHVSKSRRWTVVEYCARDRDKTRLGGASNKKPRVLVKIKICDEAVREAELDKVTLSIWRLQKGLTVYLRGYCTV